MTVLCVVCCVLWVSYVVSAPLTAVVAWQVGVLTRCCHAVPLTWCGVSLVAGAVSPEVCAQVQSGVAHVVVTWHWFMDSVASWTLLPFDAYEVPVSTPLRSRMRTPTPTTGHSSALVVH